MKKGLRFYMRFSSLALALCLLISCGGSSESGANLLIIDFSAVNEDDQLTQEAQSNLALQQNTESFFEQNKGRWTVVDQEMSASGASASFTFSSKSDLRVDMNGTIENFGKAAVVQQSPYLIEKVAIAGNGFGTSALYLKTITCEDFIEKVGNRLICGTAKIQRLEILSQTSNYLQMRDTSDGEELILKR